MEDKTVSGSCRQKLPRRHHSSSHFYCLGLDCSLGCPSTLHILVRLVILHASSSCCRLRVASKISKFQPHSTISIEYGFRPSRGTRASTIQEILTKNHIQQVPKPGEWPVDPQEDIPISADRIWIDGCFDFAHHGQPRPLAHSYRSLIVECEGHAGASLQARRLGTELLVGIHSDEAILENKGPTVMTLAER
jgi:hypothetical protein